MRVSCLQIQTKDVLFSGCEYILEDRTNSCLICYFESPPLSDGQKSKTNLLSFTTEKELYPPSEFREYRVIAWQRGCTQSKVIHLLGCTLYSDCTVRTSQETDLYLFNDTKTSWKSSWIPEYTITCLLLPHFLSKNMWFIPTIYRLMRY